MFGVFLLILLFLAVLWLFGVAGAARREEQRRRLTELELKVSQLERTLRAFSENRDKKAAGPPSEVRTPGDPVVSPLPPGEKMGGMAPAAEPVMELIPNVVAPVLAGPEMAPTSPTYIDFIHNISVASDPVASAAERDRPRKTHPIELRAEAIETFVGQRVLGWAAAVVGVLAIGFFLKYAYDQGWILPVGRVLIGEALGASLVVWGLRVHRRGYYLAAQMLNGCGLVACYLASYAAFGFYDLISQPFAAVFMSLVMLAAAALAVRTDAFALAIMTILGGLMTPLLLASDVDQHVSLFTYLALLVTSIHLLHLWKPWLALRSLVWAGAYFHFWLWFLVHGSPAARPAALVFLAVLAAVPVAHVLLVRRHARPEVEDWLLFLIAPCLGYSTTVRLLEPDLHAWIGKAAFALAALFGAVAAGLFFLGQRHKQRVQMALTLAVVFLSVSIPYELAVGWIGAGWLAVGVGLWFAGLRHSEWLLRAFAGVLLVMAAVRIVTHDLALRHDPDFIPFFNAEVVPGLLLALGLGLAAWLALRYRKNLLREERPLRFIFGWGAMACFGGVLSLELAPLAERWAVTPRWLGVPWGLYGFALLHFGMRTRCLEWRGAGWVILAAAVVRVLAGDVPVERAGPFVPLFDQRSLPVIVMAGLAAGVYVWAGRHLSRLVGEEVSLRFLAGLAAPGLFLFALSWDVHHYLPGLGLSQRWLAVVWVGYALALWAGGLFRERAEWRVFGVLLLAAAGVRSLLGDLPLARRDDFLPLLDLLSLPVVLTGFGFLLFRRLSMAFTRRLSRDEQELSMLYSVLGIALLFIIISLDGYAFFKQMGLTNRWIAVAWVLFGHGVWLAGLYFRQQPWRSVGTTIVALARLRSVIGDVPLRRTEVFVPLLNQLSLPIVLTAASLFVVRSLIKRTGTRLTQNEQRLGILSGLVAIALLFGIISLDTYQFGLVLMGPEGMLLAHAALSVVWAAFAGVLLAFGFWRKVPVWRWVALGLFCVTLGKVFLIDLGWLAGLYRILAFFCIALILAAATWAYQRRYVK